MQRPSSPLESFSVALRGHHSASSECLGMVQARLEKGAQSKYVTRFTEKNLLTHRCMARCVFLHRLAFLFHFGLSSRRFRKLAQYYAAYLEGTNVVSLSEKEKMTAQELQNNLVPLTLSLSLILSLFLHDSNIKFIRK